MLRAQDNGRRSALSRLNVSMWPLWEANGERHAVTVKPSAQPDIDLRLLIPHPVLLTPLHLFPPAVSLSFPTLLCHSLCHYAQGKPAVPKSHPGCVMVKPLGVRWETCCPSGEVRADWRCSRPRFPKVFRSVCFVSGQRNENTVSQQTCVFVVK